MKRIICLMCLCWATTASAELFEMIGVIPYSSLLQPAFTARTEALGGGVAAASGPSAAWTNPAAPTAAGRIGLEYSRAEQPLEDYGHWAAAAAARIGPVDLSLLRSRWSVDTLFRSAYLPEGNGDRFKTHRDLALLAFSTDLSPLLDSDGESDLVLRAGVGLRRYRAEVEDVELTTSDLDLGVLVGMGNDVHTTAGEWSWRLAYAHSNVTGGALDRDAWDTELIGLRTLGAALDYCAARRADGGPLLDVLVTAQTAKGVREGSTFESQESLGVELRLLDVVALRFSNGDNRSAYGAGLRWAPPEAGWGLSADYANIDPEVSLGEDELYRWTVGAHVDF